MIDYVCSHYNYIHYWSNQINIQRGTTPSFNNKLYVNAIYASSKHWKGNVINLLHYMKSKAKNTLLMSPPEQSYKH